MSKACLKYDKWKAQHNPDHKPWSNPEQLRIPRMDSRDIVAFDLAGLKNVEDESQIKENEVDKASFDED